MTRGTASGTDCEGADVTPGSRTPVAGSPASTTPVSGMPQAESGSSAAISSE
ncbi:hypothetical protein ACFQ2H_03270 [Streptomyces violaceoruber]